MRSPPELQLGAFEGPVFVLVGLLQTQHPHRAKNKGVQRGSTPKDQALTRPKGWPRLWFYRGPLVFKFNRFVRTTGMVIHHNGGAEEALCSS